MGLGLAEPGYHTRAYVEWDEYPRQCLIAAQRAGYLAPAPIFDDLTKFDARPLAGAIDTLVAGYPCQPFSLAGQRKGEDDERHLFPHVERVARELGPALRYIFLENVAGHLSLGGEQVLRAIRKMGFRSAAGLYSAGETGASHKRQRLFIVAYRGSELGRGELKEGRERRGWSQSEGSDAGVADTEGGAGRIHPRQWIEGQRAPEPRRSIADLGNAARVGCGERRTESEIRGGRDTATSAGSELADTGHALGRAKDASRDHAARKDAGRSEGDCRAGEQSADLDDAHGTRSQREGIRTGTKRERGTRLPRAGRSELADTGSDRGAARSASPKGWQERVTRKSFDYRPLRHPPGPGDRKGWRATLSCAPWLAPAHSRRGLLESAALYLAPLVTADAPDAGRPGQSEMADTREPEAMGGEAGTLVDSEQALANFRRVAHGMASRTRPLRLLGNGVHPLAAGYAWRSLAFALGLPPIDLGAGRSAHPD